MTLKEIEMSLRYVTDAEGEKTDVLVPLTTWKALLASWERLLEILEDQEDKAILLEWLEKRSRSEVEMVSLKDLEQELMADGLLSG